MGALGYTIFEDDVGADWVAGFLEDPSINTIKRILTNPTLSKNLDDREASAALCCAEIVAAGLGNAVHTISDDLCAWAESSVNDLAPLKDHATHVVDQVHENSELSMIWDEDPEWIAYIQD